MNFNNDNTILIIEVLSNVTTHGEERRNVFYYIKKNINEQLKTQNAHKNKIK